MKKALRMLEFEKIREQLDRFTLTVPGTQKVAVLFPGTAIEKVTAMQQETTEAAGLIQQAGLRFQSCGDLLPLLQRAARSGILNALELRQFQDFFQAIKFLKTFFSQEERAVIKYPRLLQLIKKCQAFPHLMAELRRCLTPQGEISDNASPLLTALRTNERRYLEEINQALASYLRTPHYRKSLQENIITVRADRYVLPVKQEFRNHIPGIVHDQSASGATLFIEPLPVVELNNRLREIKGQIEAEIEQILRYLTGLLKASSAEIANSYDLYGEFDFILARGQLSLTYQGREPLLNDRGLINISGGRHPLLAPEKVVPVDVHLGRDYNTLVITGPNTGGKTVTLKTIGLFTLMAQCGLHIPAKRGTELSVFAGVWADIGDEQDIAQSLSTFSGHMTNIINILKEAGPSSLVLLDELGAGTDPSEGSALAMAILEELHARGARTVATTHINELKVFAHLRDGLENASVEFNPQNLEPTYRLLIGVPGQSNALTVAHKLGMAPDIIDKARAYMQDELLNLEEVVSGLVEEKHRFAVDNEKIREMKGKLHFLLQELQHEKEELALQKRKTLARAGREAREMVRLAQRKTEGILKKLKQVELQHPDKEALEAVQESGRELQAMREEYEQEAYREEERGTPLAPQEIKVGQAVYVRSLRCAGEIIKVFSDREIQVRAGTMKINARLADLEKPRLRKIKEKESSGKEGQVKASRSTRALLWEKSAVDRRLDLRGLTLEEALYKVDKHLDDSILANLNEIEIIHGKGTGALRRGIHVYLAEKELVANYRLGGEGEGGSGVTIVQLR
ncbi:MAG: endonuclease MutS2 [Firmicutes bacterium]|nr:endonuclease MutS2 [Bacillota bacterium]